MQRRAQAPRGGAGSRVRGVTTSGAVKGGSPSTSWPSGGARNSLPPFRPGRRRGGTLDCPAPVMPGTGRTWISHGGSVNTLHPAIRQARPPQAN
jgi:hypothetical protein